MEENRTELMETTENTELTEVENYRTEESSSGSSLKILAGVALLGAAATGIGAVLKKKGIIKSKEERAIEKLEKAGYVIIEPVEDEAVDVEFQEEDVADDKEPEKKEEKTTSKTGKKTEQN